MPYPPRRRTRAVRISTTCSPKSSRPAMRRVPPTRPGRGRCATLPTVALHQGQALRIERRYGGGMNETDKSPSQKIDAKIEELGDWRGKTLARMRRLIKQAD